MGNAPLLLSQKMTCHYLSISKSRFFRMKKLKMLPPPVNLLGRPYYRRADLDRFVAGLVPGRKPRTKPLAPSLSNDEATAAAEEQAARDAKYACELEQMQEKEEKNVERFNVELTLIATNLKSGGQKK